MLESSLRARRAKAALLRPATSTARSQESAAAGHAVSRRRGDGARPRGAFDQIATRKRGPVRARNAAQDAYIKRPAGSTSSSSPRGRPAPARPGSRSATPSSLLEQGQAERLILSRPAVEAGERLGFLPGDMREKVDPYLRPIYDALYDFMEARHVERGLQTGMIEIAPLAFMRGRTLTNAVVLLDEAQNTTPMQMKMFLTRLGEDSRMIVTGDPTQIDLPAGPEIRARSRRCASSTASRASAASRFTGADVVRHDLVRADRHRLRARRARRGRGGPQSEPAAPAAELKVGGPYPRGAARHKAVAFPSMSMIMYIAVWARTSAPSRTI